MKNFRTLDDLDARGKTVLLRADLNVPMQDGKISDSTRIDRVAPTVNALVENGARVVILSHFGRPKGKADLSMSLQPLLPALSAALGRDVSFAADCVGGIAAASVKALKDGDVLLLENVRFHAGEEKDDADFAAQIAALGDIYVNDAFSAAHRAHATTHGIAKLLPAYAGRLMEAELVALEKALGSPKRPVVALVGGAKISTKLDLLNNLVTKIDVLVLGGGMANTFLFAKGHDVGKSLCEKELAETARSIMTSAEKHGCDFVLPVDAVTAKEFKANTATEIKAADNVAADDLILDIGPKTVALVEEKLKTACTLLWNGPMGAFETPPFDAGTMQLAAVVAGLTQNNGLVSVGGGGDTVSALAQAKVLDDMSYVSTAGGAFLEWMEGKVLPGVAALEVAAAKKLAAG